VIGTWLIAALCTGALAVAGLPYALLLAPRGIFRLLAAWLLGSCLLPAAMLAAGALDARFSRLELAMLWLAVTTGGCVLLLLRGRTCKHVAPTILVVPQRDLITMVGMAVCLVQTVYVLLVAVRVPLSSYDAWSVWEYRGRRFWMDGVVTADFLHSQSVIFAHPAYPPVLSLLITWVYTWTGTDTPVYMKLLYLAFYVVLLATFYLGLRATHSQRLAALATAALALVPRVTEYAGTGLADVPLTAFVVAGLAAYAIARNASPPALPMAGLLLGLAPLMKREGLFFLLAAVLSIALRERSLRRTAAWLWPAPFVALPWYFYVAISGVPDRDFMPFTPQDVLAHLDRAAVVGRFFAINMLALNEWNVLWYAFAAVLCLALLQRRPQVLWLLPMVAAPLILYVLALGVSAWPDYLLHARTSLDRLILVTTPFAVWMIVEQLDSVSTSQRQRAAPALPGLASGSDR
jgi:4-amino-4-deoxy-L-arabinose transferase-like glycosyltransferase